MIWGWNEKGALIETHFCDYNPKSHSLTLSWDGNVCSSEGYANPTDGYAIQTDCNAAPTDDNVCSSDGYANQSSCIVCSSYGNANWPFLK